MPVTSTCVCDPSMNDKSGRHPQQPHLHGSERPWLQHVIQRVVYCLTPAMYHRTNANQVRHGSV